MKGRRCCEVSQEAWESSLKKSAETISDELRREPEVR